MKTTAVGLFRALLAIRFRQLIRTIAELGVLRVLFLLFIAVYMVGPVSRSYSAGALWGTGYLILIMSVIHFSRKDLHFLTGVFGRSAYRAMAGEYGLLALPFLGYEAWSRNWPAVLILMTAVVLLPFLRIRRRGRRWKGSPAGWFPAKAFELRSCFRENRIVLGAVLLAGLVFSRQIAVPLLSIAIISILYAFSTARNESRCMLESFSSSSELLGYKMGAYLRVLLVSLSPLILAFICFHFPQWYLLLALLIACCCIVLLSIVLKYAFFSPGQEVKTNQLLTVLGLASFVIVYLAPVPFIMLLVYYPKARRHLDRYFYA